MVSYQTFICGAPIHSVMLGFIAAASFIWAIVLGVYISKEWSHFNGLQRKF